MIPRPRRAHRKDDPPRNRLDRRRLKRVTVSPETIGLCGCRQVIAVLRDCLE